MAMLRESSIITATTFCCGRSVAMLIAGCQSRNSSSATMAVSSSQITSGRAPVSDPRLRRTCHSSSPAAAITLSASIHTGHDPSSTNCPFWKTAPGYLKKNSTMKALDLMRHCVNDVVDAHAISLRSVTLGVTRMVGPLPGIAIILVKANGHHHPAVVVVNGAPMRRFTVLFPDPAGVPVLYAGHLNTLVQII